MVRVRAVSGTADQLFSSVSNGLIVYAIAVVTPVDAFGQAALTMTLIAAAVGVLRGALGTPLLLTAGRDGEFVRSEAAFALTTALLLSPVVAVLIGLVADPGLTVAGWWFIAAAPVVLAQDVLRYAAIAQGRPHVAALWDGLWFLASVALLTSTWWGLRAATTSNVVACWAISASVSMAGIMLGTGVTPRIIGYRRWLSAGWADRLRYGTDSGLEQTTVFVILLGVAAVLNDGVTAALRGATALMAPVGIVVSAISLVVIPESARTMREPPAVWRALVRATAATSAFALIIGAVLVTLPPRIGEYLLGDTFIATQGIVAVIAAEYALGSWTVAVAVYLRTFNRSTDALRLKLAYVIVMLIGAIGAATLFGSALAVAIGIASATAIMTVAALSVVRPWQSAAGFRRAERVPGAESQALS